MERYIDIVKSGSILVEPDIPDSERWCTGGGESHYPFVRHIGGVSLFDFDGFNWKAYSKKYTLSSWRSFVPKQKDWTYTVWLKIDRDKVKNNIIEGAALLKKWKDDNKYGHNIMPLIECAHIGDLPITSCSSVLIYDDFLQKFTNQLKPTVQN
jgi:hypothetical protein